MTWFEQQRVVAGGTSRFPQTSSTGPLTRTGGFAAGKRA
jgi:hypothetical protein